MRGFTLIEMAVVVAVIALLLGSILVPLVTQIEERRFGETRRIIEEAREALIGFAIANGRLPCPATGTTGVETVVSGVCSLNSVHIGFLPAVDLGILPTDEQGFAVDPWGNRIRYAVTGSDSNAFITANGIRTQFLTSTPNPNIRVCSSGSSPGTGADGLPICNAGPPDTALTNSAVAVIYSIGPNGRTGGTSTDEAQNPNPNSADSDRLFVSRSFRGEGTAAGEYDDVLVWVSPHILYNRMVAAGRLP